MRETSIHENKIKVSDDIVGPIRINPKSYTDAFIHDPAGGPDIYIVGLDSRNTAMEGDIVTVRLNPTSKWKLNRNIIANKWDLWAEHLIPIIQELEATDTIFPANQSESINDCADGREQVDSISSPAQTSSKLRVKRNTVNDQKDSGATQQKNSARASKVPSNLPAGISMLQLEHVLNLPFSSLCVQKTGYVKQIVKRNHSGLAGGFLKSYSADYALFSPTDARVPRILIDIKECPLDFLTTPDRYKNVLFICQMTDWQANKNFARGSMVKIVGDSNDVQSRMEALLMEQQVYDIDFTPDVYRELEYLENLPKDWFARNTKDRRDLTRECIFTIDPKTARDLDDAVSIKQIAEQIYEVGVHIADVSYFVKEMTAVDYHARLRTTSVYLVERVIPMLPRILCERMCSLNAGEPKLCFSVIWKMDKYGRIIDEWFGRTVINSCVKLAYEHAQNMIEAPNDISWIKEEENMPKLHAFDWKRISKSVNMLNKIAQNMRAKRFEGGALRIEQVKLKYELDPESGCPTGFSMESRSEANFLIEEYMLLANMAVAKRIYKFSKELAFLRRHPRSDAALLKEVKEFCDAKGCPLDIATSGSLQKSLNSIKDPTMAKVVSFLLLRAMQNAEYICVGSLPVSDDNFSHFALNAPFYTHFTSPIRRYPDIIVHRMLAQSLGLANESHEDIDSLTKMADECTKRKNSSKKISDTSQKLYFNLFVKKAGFCELLACVTKIYDQSFDVILVDYDRQGRVYLDKLKNELNDFKFESHSGIRRLILNWKSVDGEVSKKSKKRKAKKAKKLMNDLDSSESRNTLEERRPLFKDSGMRINEAVSDQQVIEVFDVIRVIVKVEEKDITQLKIELKPPVVSS